MDDVLSQAHEILRFCRELENALEYWLVLVTGEKEARSRIDTKATITVRQGAWGDILPRKGSYFRLTHYLAALKHLLRFSKEIPRALEDIASSPTLHTIRDYAQTAISERNSQSKMYGGFPVDFMLRSLQFTKSIDDPCICAYAIRLAQACPLLKHSYRHFVSRLSLPLNTKAKQQLRHLQKDIDEIGNIDNAAYTKLVSAIRTECAQVVALSFLEIAPVKARTFLQPSQQRILDALKAASTPLKYEALLHEAGIGSRSTLANGLKTLVLLGLARALPGGGFVYVDKGISDTSGAASQDI